jgi:hypothetical protein
MDPNEALKRLREIMPRLQAWAEAEEWSIAPSDLTQHDTDLAEVVETFEGLDQWLSKGGFLPADWAVGR